MSQKKDTSKSQTKEEALLQGYVEMAELNLELAHKGEFSDSEALKHYEEKLMESE